MQERILGLVFGEGLRSSVPHRCARRFAYSTPGLRLKGCTDLGTQPSSWLTHASWCSPVMQVRLSVLISLSAKSLASHPRFSASSRMQSVFAHGSCCTPVLPQRRTFHEPIRQRQICLRCRLYGRPRLNRRSIATVYFFGGFERNRSARACGPNTQTRRPETMHTSLCSPRPTGCTVSAHSEQQSHGGLGINCRVPISSARRRDRDDCWTKFAKLNAKLGHGTSW